MAREISSDERRIKELESQMLRLWAALRSLRDKANQVAEEMSRQMPDANMGRMFTRGQSVGVIAARSGASPGTGTFRFLELWPDGVEYLTQPFADGDVTAGCVNDTGGATINNEYLDLVMIDGVWTAIVGDCVTVAPTRAPDPPA